MMGDRDTEDFGFARDDDETDGPDVTQAREALEESSTPTDEIDVIISESRRLVQENLQHGYQNHFVQKWAQLIRAGGSAA